MDTFRSKLLNLLGTNNSDIPSSALNVRERQRVSMHLPKLFLMARDSAYITMADIRDLLLLGVKGTPKRRTKWCRLLRTSCLSGITLLLLEDVDWCTAQTNLKESSGNFLLSAPLAPPATTALEELVMGSKPIENIGGVIKKQVDIAGRAVSDNALCSAPRTALLLSSAQMLAEAYPLPSEVSSDMLVGYTLSLDKYTAVTDCSPLFAVDCEMVLTTTGALELARVSLVDEHLNCLLDMLVKPTNEIVDYLTRYSGITKDLLEPVTAQLQDAQTALRQHLPEDAILCGHSLSSDLHALKLFHPYVIDTSVLFSLSGELPSFTKKASLKRLSASFLNMEIQNHGKLGHFPTEDAIATMRLVLLKMQRGVHFGCISDIMSPLSVPRSDLFILRHLARAGRSGALIGADEWPGRKESSAAEISSSHWYRCLRDQQVFKVAKNLSSRNEQSFLNIIQLSDYRDACQRGDAKESIQCILKKYDRRICQILSEISSKSLVIVVGPGTSQPRRFGFCWLKISE